MIRILLVDDDNLVRSGIRMVLERFEHLMVVGEAETGRQAVALAGSLDPDIVLMDIRMPGVDGIAATELISRLPDGPRVIVLTTFEHEAHVFGALRAGASGFLSKRVEPDELATAIEAVAAGDSLLSPTATRQLIDHIVDPPTEDPLIARLTPREREVLKQLATGQSNDEIAASLGIAANTAKTHVKRVLAKLSARDRAQAVAIAYQRGVMDSIPPP